MKQELKMGTKKNGRAPVSQKPHRIEKPEHPEYIGGTVSIQINEKKLTVREERITVSNGCLSSGAREKFLLTKVPALF